MPRLNWDEPRSDGKGEKRSEEKKGTKKPNKV